MTNPTDARHVSPGETGTHEVGVQPSRPRRVRPPRPVAPGMARRCYYLPDEVWSNAKAAFLVDWRDGGTADSMAAWVGTSLRQFAALTTRERREAIPLDNTTKRPSSNRSMTLPQRDVDAMDDARHDDTAADMHTSYSEWVTAALTLATNTTRHRNGGALPPAPARLPNRLSR